jgi:type IV pilus assembly protein PilY1
MADPAYCHIYTVDLTPYIFDASIGAVGAGDISASTRTASSWRTILIGGMRLGGACKDSAYAGTSGVKVPVADKGYSSYFALDVTDQNNPVLLWEFTNTNLGFATGGPAVVRVNAVNPSTSQPDKSLNGKWFVVFASGPTGPIDSNERQFLGQSDQELKLFVLDLKTGNLLATLPTGISDAFGGSIINSTHDIDLDYQDDVVYIPYVRKDATSGTWTQGGVVRLQTRENPAPSTTNWPVTKVIDGVGPVTSSVVKLQSTATNIMWLFFGTGRYFYEKEKATDDGTSVRSLYGIKDLCFSSTGFAASCGSSLSAGGLVDVTTDVVPPSTDLTSTSYTGWFINLDSHGDYTYAEGHPTPVDVTRRYWAERVITDPLAASTGVVFFTSYKPHDDPCKIGGKTFIWAVRYDTGGDPSSLLKGKALVQVSTGSIEQIDLSGAFGDKKQTGATGGRRSSAMEGVPPTAQGLSILSSPPALKRVLHIKER